MDLYQVSYR